MKGLKFVLIGFIVLGCTSLQAKSGDPDTRFKFDDPIKKDSSSLAEPDTTVSRTVFFPNPFIQLILTPPEEKDKQDPGI